VNDEVERMREKVLLAKFDVSSYNLPGWTEENNEKSVRIISVSAKIRTRHVSYTSYKR
jgi:hypothetical protein